MPRGVYHLAGRPEAFSCAPGPAGWRYTSEALDLACDAAFGCVRFEVRAGGVAVRGGRAVLDDGTPVLAWVGPDGVERYTAAEAVDGVSPGHLVVLCRRVALPGEAPAARVLRVLRLEPPSLGGVTVTRRVARVSAQLHDAPSGQLLVETWHVDDPDTGVRRVAHLAGDVVLAATSSGATHTSADDDIELADLDSPPSLAPPRPQ